MKCEGCLELLEEYLDGEVAPDDQEHISAHLITCADCSSTFGTLNAEQELFDRYDREIEVPPFLWTRIAEHSFAENNRSSLGWRARVTSLFATPATLFAGAIAILLLAVAVGVIYSISSRPASNTQVADSTPEQKNDATLPRDKTPKEATTSPDPRPELIASTPRPKRRVKPAIKSATSDQADVLSSDLGYLDFEDRDTARHIEQTQNLLRSIRNFPVSDGDEEIDVTYDKALSRRLLNENVVLRRDAEMKAKFPTKTILADLEPFLIDIANLPDHARAEDVRVIKERVQRTEIVAALVVYKDRGTNNR